MRRCVRHGHVRLVVLASMLGTAGTVRAQSPPGSDDHPGAIGKGPPAPASSPRPAWVTQSYDARTGYTTVSARLPEVTDGVELSVRARYAGALLHPAADSVALFITCVGGTRRLGRWDGLDLVLDGDRPVHLEFPEPSTDSRTVTGQYVEQLSVVISRAEFAELVSARAIGGRVGTLTFWIAGGAHDALRDFGERIARRDAKSVMGDTTGCGLRAAACGPQVTPDR